LFLSDSQFLTSLPLVLQNSVGLSNNLSRLLAACNSVSYLLFSFAGIVLIERAGRRKLMMWGAAGQCVCYMFISGFLAQADDPVYGTRYGAGATVFFFTYYLFFGICWQVGLLLFDLFYHETAR
jgi:nitrate/nitrite transporter NarK